MNLKAILIPLFFTFIGLVIGYWFFGKFAGEHLSLSTLFGFGGNAFQNIFQSISGIEAMRNKILLCAVAGTSLGLLVSFKLKKLPVLERISENISQ